MLTVTAAQSSQQSWALSLLFSQSSDVERVEQISEWLESARCRAVSLDGLLTTVGEGDLAGVVFYVLQADRSAVIWPPRVQPKTDARRDELCDALLQEVGRRIDVADVWLGQCIVKPEATTDRSALNRNGFQHLADLFYLQRPLNEPLAEPPEIAFETLMYSSSNRQRFARILEETYIGTLDCPDFHGLRSGAEALESHRTSGEFDASRWKIYCIGGCDVGVLLLNDHPQQNAWEVVYTGVVPQARGQGYGRAILIAGLNEAQAAGRATVVLAVDSKNIYANKVYSELGFLELTRRSVHVRRRFSSGI